MDPTDVVTRFELMTWIAGGVVLVTPWFLWSGSVLKAIRADGSELLKMHRNPEDTGFGTVGFRGVIQDNTRAIRELSHYVRMSTKATTGKDILPFVGE